LPDHHPADADDLADTRRKVILDVAVMPFPIWRGHQQRDAATQDIRRPITEQSFGGRAELVDETLLVDNDNGVRDCLQNRPQPRFALMNPLLGRHGLQRCDAAVFNHVFPKSRRHSPNRSTQCVRAHCPMMRARSYRHATLRPLSPTDSVTASYYMRV